jgi:hypothetical protein
VKFFTIHRNGEDVRYGRRLNRSTRLLIIAIVRAFRTGKCSLRH